MSVGRRARRLVEWNTTLHAFFFSPITVGQLLLLTLTVTGIGMLLFGMWRLEVESGNSSWDNAMKGRLAANVESRLEPVERVARVACGHFNQGNTAGAFAAIAGAERQVLKSEQGIVLVLRGDSVVLWSGSYPRAVEKRISEDQAFVRINGMLYYMRPTRYDSLTAYAGVAIRSDYPINNRYLQSRYVPSLSFMEGRNLDVLSLDEATPSKRASSPPQRSNLQMLLAYIFIFFAIITAPVLLTRHRSVVVTLLAIACSVGWRFLFLYYVSFDGILGHLFSPSLFAFSRLVPSLGDFFFHALVVLSSTMLSSRLMHYLALSRRIPQRTFLALCGVGAVLVLISGDMLLRKIVINSTQTIPPYEISSFTFYTHIAYTSLALWFLSGALLAAMFCRQLFRCPVPQRWQYWTILGLVAILFSFSLWEQAAVPFGPAILLCTLVFTSLYVPLRCKAGKLPFRGMEFIVGIVVALYAATCSGFESKRRDLMVREQLAERVGGEHDPVIEAILPELTQAVEADGALRRFVLSGYRSHSSMRRYFEERYQRNYLHGYDVQLTVCYRDEMILLAGQDDFEDCATYFGKIIATEGIAVPESNFYFRHGRSGRISYLGVFSFADRRQERFLYVEFVAKQPNAFWGYPELLVNEPVRHYKIDPAYHTALYQHGVLLMQTGEFAYPRTLLATGYDPSRKGIFESLGYTHVAKELPDGMVAFVSRGKVSPFDVMGVDVYALLLFSILFSIGFRLSRVLQLKPLIGRGIVGRLQFSMAGVMVLTMTLALVIALFTMRKTLDERNRVQMREKSQTVLAALRQMGVALPRGSTKDNWQLNRALSELSNRLYCDINVYDTLGWLVGSSRMEVFSKSLIGERMNATAWGALRYGGASQQIIQEQIGTLSYESAYIPLRQNGVRIGYLNLPYFARPDVLTRQFQSFTSLLLDFYGVLTCLMLLLSFVLVNSVLDPLAKLRKSIETLSITGENKLVFYDTPDQIGALFRAYNAMLNQLASSAAELAESSRQRAWQEMARQIAHDIKNPLTPIRLSLQRVLRLRAARNPLWEERFLEFSVMLENQIDVLTRTANTFSTFAQLAEGHASFVDVRSAVHKCVLLYAADPRARVREKLAGVPLKVWVDENNLQRMVNNLVINAVQAASQVQHGEVVVRCYAILDGVIIEVLDNGQGIPPERQDDIFNVHFTTKSEGSGLGLAITKAMARACGGSVSFLTCPPCGSLFRIFIPTAHGAVEAGHVDKKL